MLRRSMSLIGFFALVALPLLGQGQEKKTYNCSMSMSRKGTARIGIGSGVKTMGTVETQTQTTVRFLPCELPDGIDMPQFEGSAREGFDAVLATINKDLKKKKQVTLRVDPSVEQALSARKARYAPGGYRVEELFNNLCGGRCEWQFEEQGEGLALLVSPRSPTAAP